MGRYGRLVSSDEGIFGRVKFLVYKHTPEASAPPSMGLLMCLSAKERAVDATSVYRQGSRRKGTQLSEEPQP